MDNGQISESGNIVAQGKKPTQLVAQDNSLVSDYKYKQDVLSSFKKDAEAALKDLDQTMATELTIL